MLISLILIIILACMFDFSLFYICDINLPWWADILAVFIFNGFIVPVFIVTVIMYFLGIPGPLVKL